MKLVDGLMLENPRSKEIKRNERECGLMKDAKKVFLSRHMYNIEEFRGGVQMYASPSGEFVLKSRQRL